MSHFRRFLSLLLILMLLPLMPLACAEEGAASDSGSAAVTGSETAVSEPAPFRGWSKKAKYQYVTFGSYPQTSADKSEPVLWMVLGVDKDTGYALLMTEYVIEMYPIIWVESKKDRDNHNFRKIKDIREGDIYGWMNSEMINRLLTPAEQAVLKDTGDGVYLYVLDRAEMTNEAYGFAKRVYGHNITSRITLCTNYAKDRGCIALKGGTTYWVSGLKPGNPYRMSIVGYNGHISYAGCGRQNVGIRPGCWVKMDQVSFSSGSGTKENPYVITAHE